MIKIKSNLEAAKMREAGKIAAMARAIGGEAVRAGVTTSQIDKIIHKFILSKGAKASFYNYNGFPSSACISVNEEVIHGIPSDRILKNGDIVKIDVGAFYKGYHGDCAETFFVGEVPENVKKLVAVTRESFYIGMEMAHEGNRIGDISSAVDSYVVANNFSSVRDFTGHGIGENLHEDPSVPNYGRAGHGARLQNGMTLAIEPMVNEGSWQVEVLKDGWTTITKDRKMSAHYENTILITDNGPEILTKI
ncbi:type I methionyl aminopeptidase [Eubacteriales bacterium OttesenSCG-928-G02]|nr:type I methionyl aminopeptidase [Eubacteriales bacterium OttesenSCG-928-G02]